MKHLVLSFMLLVSIFFVSVFEVTAADNTANQAGKISESEFARIDALFDKGLEESYKESGYIMLKESLDLCLKVLEKDPDNYDALWRCSRSAAEYAETAMSSNKEGWKAICKEWGKKGMDFGDKAQKIEPNRVEAYLWQVVSIGKYSKGVGVFTAVKEGFLKKSKRSIAKSYELDKTYYDYSPVNAKAMINCTLPWPWKDKKKALKYYREYADNTEWSFEAYIRYPLAAELLMSFKDEELNREAKKLLEAALSDPNPRPLYYNQAKELLEKLK